MIRPLTQNNILNKLTYTNRTNKLILINSVTNNKAHINISREIS